LYGTKGSEDTEVLMVAQMNYATTRTRADAQFDGRPAKYKCRPLLNATKFG